MNCVEQYGLWQKHDNWLRRKRDTLFNTEYFTSNPLQPLSSQEAGHKWGKSPASRDILVDGGDGLVVYYLTVRSTSVHWKLTTFTFFLAPPQISRCPPHPTSHLQSKYEVLKSHYVVFTKCTDFLTFLCLDCKVSPMQWLEISSRFLSSHTVNIVWASHVAEVMFIILTINVYCCRFWQVIRCYYFKLISVREIHNVL